MYLQCNVPAGLCDQFRNVLYLQCDVLKYALYLSSAAQYGLRQGHSRVRVYVGAVTTEVAALLHLDRDEHLLSSHGHAQGLTVADT